MIDNGSVGGPEYTTSAQQWIPEGYEAQMINGQEVKECAVCSNNSQHMLRREPSGHYICYGCYGGEPRSGMARPPHRGQKPKPSAVSTMIYSPAR